MLKENSLKGKNILITGGGTGLGKSMSAYFLKLGANVIIGSRNANKIKQCVKEFSIEFPNQITGISCDVRNYDDIKKIIDYGESKFGLINGVVNNAAGNFISPTERLSPNAFSVIIDIVLKGTCNMSLAIGKKWLKNDIKGTMLNIVTTYAWTGSGYVVPSAVSKAGVLALTRSLAVEWGKKGIRSNAIAPGPFPTKGAWDRLFPKIIQEKFILKDRIPLNRVGEHHELTNLAGYLMSDYSSFINGEVITIDGGEWLKSGGEFNWLDKIPSEMWDGIEGSIRGERKS
ncbi:MAG: short-chain dehydrogenase [Candidatus Marinimicrobia bacterium]|nr:short-chain dehydrogenase [Candidatus Neomarinimicrobiota bacterium]